MRTEAANERMKGYNEKGRKYDEEGDGGSEEEEAEEEQRAEKRRKKTRRKERREEEKKTQITNTMKLTRMTMTISQNSPPDSLCQLAHIDPQVCANQSP